MHCEDLWHKKLLKNLAFKWVFNGMRRTQRKFNLRALYRRQETASSKWGHDAFCFLELCFSAFCGQQPKSDDVTYRHLQHSYNDFNGQNIFLFYWIISKHQVCVSPSERKNKDFSPDSGFLPAFANYREKSVAEPADITLFPPTFCLNRQEYSAATACNFLWICHLCNVWETTLCDGIFVR